jgi:hypothetical protein
MSRGDFVALPQVSCAVARTATDAWHDDIKNGLLWWSDDERLEKRLLDEAFLSRLKNRVEYVCARVDEFCGANLVSQLGPLSSLPQETRGHLERALARAFESDFRPAEVKRNLVQDLEALLARIRGLHGTTPADPEARHRQLDDVRAAARSLGERLSRLPRGPWLPRRDTPAQPEVP